MQRRGGAPGQPGQPQVYVMNTAQKTETGHKARASNIAAAKAVSDIVRSCLGPRAMLKMMLNPMGGIAITNDGNAVLREIDVAHPAAKSMIELSRAQDEAVGDGTTGVVVLAGEALMVATPFLERGVHPTKIIAGYVAALDDALAHMDAVAKAVDVADDAAVLALIGASVRTKFIARWADQMCAMAWQAVRLVHESDAATGRNEVDLKRNVRVERVPGGDLDECRVVRGVMLNKDVTHAKMRRRIERPRIILLDCPLEYKKGESKTDLEISKAEDYTKVLQQEEAAIEAMCAAIIKLRPDVVLTEKGLSDLAQHYFVQANITAFRRLRKTDNNRLARACGAKICHRPDEIVESDVGLGCGLMEVRKVGDEYFTFFEACDAPKACTLLLRGASKDVLAEVDRNLQDAMCTARNLLLAPKLVPGGGAIEMSVAHHLSERAKAIEGVRQWPYRALAGALEVIPRTLAENCGANAVRLLTEIRAKHAADARANVAYGVDGSTGRMISMDELGVWDPLEVKSQQIKAAVEAAVTLLRVDEILSGAKKQGGGGGGDGGGGGGGGGPQMMQPDAGDFED